MVPIGFKKQPQLVLQIGLNLAVPIPDLRLDDEGMTCTLSFNRSPFYCVVPWSSVFAMVGDDGRGMVWPDDVPPAIATNAQARQAEPPAKRPPPKRPPVVEAAVEAAEEKPAAPAAKAKKPRAKKPRAAAAAVEPEPDLRPMLVAVPSPAPAEKRPPRIEAAEKKRAPLEKERRPAPSPGAHAPKPKRELPPYLRVVK
jgi:hypothetical protein